MNLKVFFYVGLLFSLSFCGCSGKSFGRSDDTVSLKINRFDTVFYEWIQTDDAAALTFLQDSFPAMTALLGKALFKDTNAYTPAYYDNLINYFSEPTLKTLYHTAITYYSADSVRTKDIARELGATFVSMKSLLPDVQIPAVYFHISGLQQNFIVADSLISCSIDKYLGADYPLYQDYFYDYQLRNMTSSRMVNDFLTVWLKSENPFQGKDNVLLDRMIYEGKILYVMAAIYQSAAYKDLMNLTDEEDDWLKNNESAIWTAIIERKHLYDPDIVTTEKYFLPSPATFLSDEAPGNIGSFIGYRIVEAYMQRTKSDMQKLMKNTDYQDIITQSKYKP
ncbi:MAG: gliding motility protein GldB [Tannerella sp.]|jgi:hypothetical protein|nr:gliding motility protein GldB [Tannerella sp.]